MESIIEQLNELHIPIVTMNKHLETYATKVLFADKVQQANETLHNVGLPTLPR
jgi:hypothetical protein